MNPKIVEAHHSDSYLLELAITVYGHDNSLRSSDGNFKRDNLSFKSPYP